MNDDKLWEILHSLWIIPSIIVFINGLGLMYTGLRVHKRQWFIEGVIYELPYILFQVIFNDVYTNDPMNMTLRMLSFLAISLSLIRSIMIRKTFIQLLKNEKHSDVEDLSTHSSSISEINAIENNKNQKININTAGLEELLTIPGFNTILAKQLIQYRNTGNYIQSEDDLANKLSLSKHQVERISEFIIIEMPNKDVYDDYHPRLDL